ncbi:MAG: helix-turn-helix domain-containing protein [Alphaproteobacteria bacterium]|nr:helix-turn-helix domain-containing protein [Alphaproteobacteria bacterium]
MLSLFEWAFKHDIRPHRFYSTQELANLLGIERIEAIEMVRSGKVKGKKLDGNYRILGSAILEYMSQ